MPANESMTIAALAAALDAASVRGQVHAANIANANVAGYTPLAVSFSARMDALQGGSMWGAARPQLQVDLAPQLDANGQPQAVRLDDEMARVAQNALHYQALVKGLNQYMGLLGSAVSEGKK